MTEAPGKRQCSQNIPTLNGTYRLRFREERRLRERAEAATEAALLELKRLKEQMAAKETRERERAERPWVHEHHHPQLVEAVKNCRANDVLQARCISERTGTLVAVMSDFFGTSELMFKQEITTLEQLDREIFQNKEHAAVFCTYGAGGQGKTELCRQLVLNQSANEFVIMVTYNQTTRTHYNDNDPIDKHSLRGLWRRLMMQLGASAEDIPAPPSLLEFFSAVRTALGEKLRIILCVDEVMKITDDHVRRNLLDELAAAAQLEMVEGRHTHVLVTTVRGLPVFRQLVTESRRRLRPVQLTILSTRDREKVARRFAEEALEMVTDENRRKAFAKNLHWAVKCAVFLCGNHMRALEEVRNQAHTIMQQCEAQSTRKPSDIGVAAMAESDTSIRVSSLTIRSTTLPQHLRPLLLKIFVESLKPVNREDPETWSRVDLNEEVHDLLADHHAFVKFQYATGMEVHLRVALPSLFATASRIVRSGEPAIPAWQLLHELGCELTERNTRSTSEHRSRAFEAASMYGLLLRALAVVAGDRKEIPISAFLPGAVLSPDLEGENISLVLLPAICNMVTHVRESKSTSTATTIAILEAARAGQATVICQASSHPTIWPSCSSRDCLHKATDSQGIEFAFTAKSNSEQIVIAATAKLHEEPPSLQGVVAKARQNMRAGEVVLAIAPTFKMESLPNRTIVLHGAALVETLKPFGLFPFLCSASELNDKRTGTTSAATASVDKPVE